jgi:hypothetical protein
MSILRKPQAMALLVYNELCQPESVSYRGEEFVATHVFRRVLLDPI